MPGIKLAVRAFFLGGFLCTAVCAQSSPASLAGDPEPDSQFARSFQFEVRALFDKENFQKLDEIADGARRWKERFRGGGWKLNAFYGALRGPGSLTSTDEVWNAHIERLQRWIAGSPTSISPRVALAAAYLRFAWKGRGYGTGETVTDEGWKLFQERVDGARDTLEQAGSVSTPDAQWYREMQTVALAQGSTESQARQLAGKGERRRAGLLLLLQRAGQLPLAQVVWKARRG
jgi:Domain of unknown function (DUF4034)